MSNSLPPAYPFDPTGTALTNRVTSETQVLTFGQGQSQYTFIPAAAPFFSEGLVIGYRALDGTTRNLVRGTDYLPTNQFIGASRATTHDIYGSVTIINTSLSGLLTYQYQTIGGIWTISPDTIISVLAEAQADPRITVWEQIVNLPQTFPVINHEWNLNDLVGVSQLITAINQLTASVTSSITTGLTQHLNDSNPHHITPHLIGTLTTTEIQTLIAGITLPVVGQAVTYGGLVNGGHQIPASISVNQQGQITGVTLVNLPLFRADKVTLNAGAGSTVYNVTYSTAFPDAAVLSPPVLTPYDSTINASVYGGLPVLTAYTKTGFSFVIKSYLAAPNDKLAGISYMATATL